MGKPILFDTISRVKFDGLSDDVKAKRNYQIKEEDGTISKHIAGLEGGSGGGEKVFELSFSDSHIVTVNTVGEINDYAKENGLNFTFDIILLSSEGETYGKFYPSLFQVEGSNSMLRGIHFISSGVMWTATASSLEDYYSFEF